MIQIQIGFKSPVDNFFNCIVHVIDAKKLHWCLTVVPIFIAFSPADGSHTSKVTHPSALDEVGDHDEDVHVLLPDHPPEAVEGGRQRALGADVRPRLLVAVDEVGVDVVAALLRPERLQRHPRVVV